MEFLDKIMADMKARDDHSFDKIIADIKESEEWNRQYRAARDAERAQYVASAPSYALADGTIARARYLLGRLANGSEYGGSLNHIVPEGKRTAICGSTDGRKSQGFSDMLLEPATCPRCLKSRKLAR